MSEESRVAGLLLAAGAGRRMGQPKALVRGADGETWVIRATRVLLDSGCTAVVVVVGARADEVSRVLAMGIHDEPRLVVRRAELWSDGASVSLRVGLEALSPDQYEGALVTLVDTPSLRRETVERIRAAGCLGAGHLGGGARNALVQATFDGRPGHPVFLGSAHWRALDRDLHGDSGARDYLREHSAAQVECSDLESGNDIDTIGDMSMTQL